MGWRDGGTKQQTAEIKRSCPQHLRWPLQPRNVQPEHDLGRRLRHPAAILHPQSQGDYSDFIVCHHSRSRGTGLEGVTNGGTFGSKQRQPRKAQAFWSQLWSCRHFSQGLWASRSLANKATDPFPLCRRLFKSWASRDDPWAFQMAHRPSSPTCNRSRERPASPWNS